MLYIITYINFQIINAISPIYAVIKLFSKSVIRFKCDTMNYRISAFYKYKIYCLTKI